MAYSEEQIRDFKAVIIDALTNGVSLLNLEKEKKIPARATVYSWLNERSKAYDEDFLNNYTRAREDSADCHYDSVFEIVEQVNDGTLTPEQARVMIDAHKWGAGVKAPKKYGKQIDVTTGGKAISTAIPLILSDGRTYDDLTNELEPE